MAIPERFHLRDVASRFPQTFDIFICSASYEKRCLSIPLQINPSIVNRALICANEDHIDRMAENFGHLKAHFANKAREVMLRTDNPLVGGDRLQKAIQESIISKPRTLVIDVTTFTHEGLLILLKLLSISLRQTDQVWIAYAPASEYAVGLEGDKKWLSRGIREIRSVLGYPGLLKPSQKMHLVILVGFEAERAELLIDAWEPDAVSLGKGFDATDEAKRHLPTNIRTLRQLLVHYPRHDEFDFSCIDAGATKVALELQVAKYPDHNTVIAPMNTKLSTIGAGLYALSNSDAQICYAPALTYNISNYSAPGEHCLLSELPLFGERPRRRG